MKMIDPAQLKSIAYNCRKATYLIEKQQIGKITMREKLELKIHLAGCSICVTFMKQSKLINQMARNLLSSGPAALKLDESYKKKLRERIDDHLANN